MYAAARRSGIAGRIGWLRAELRHGDAPVMQARSLELAELVARFLNGEDVRAREVPEPSPLSRYTVAGPDKKGRVSVVADETARRPAAFGGGQLVRTEDAGLARRVAEMLNRVDPAPRAPSVAGWF
jgi:hypothetical protein